jgi:hypothetical protein
MNLRDQMAADAEALFNLSELAEEVNFTPDDGEPRTIRTIINEGPDFGKGNGGPVVSALATMSVLKADFPTEKPTGIITRADGSALAIGQELSSNPMTRRVEIKTRPRAAFRG